MGDKKPIYKRWWAIMIYIIVVFSIIGALIPDSEETSKTTSTSTPKKEEIQIVSTSFSDYDIYCTGSGATSLKKENTFNEKFKDKYVKWSGTVNTVTESYGNYKMSVRHCSTTWTSDIDIKMKEDQKAKLLDLTEGDKVTYTARLTRYGEILGLDADNGELVS